MRVLNAFYDKLADKYGKEPMSADEFKHRKQIIILRLLTFEDYYYCLQDIKAFSLYLFQIPVSLLWL